MSAGAIANSRRVAFDAAPRAVTEKTPGPEAGSFGPRCGGGNAFANPVRMAAGLVLGVMSYPGLVGQAAGHAAVARKTNTVAHLGRDCPRDVQTARFNSRSDRSKYALDEEKAGGPARRSLEAPTQCSGREMTAETEGSAESMRQRNSGRSISILSVVDVTKRASSRRVQNRRRTLCQLGGEGLRPMSISRTDDARS